MSSHASPRKAKTCAYPYIHHGHPYKLPARGNRPESREWCNGRKTNVGDEDFGRRPKRRLAWVAVVAVGLVVMLAIGYLFGGVA